MSPQTESPGTSSAVIYFAKAPVPGQVKTRLCPPLSTDEAAALYASFLRRVVVPVAGCRTFVYGWPEASFDHLIQAVPALGEGGGVELRPQVGADLWARMNHCFGERFAAGHRSVLIRNTDSPDLEPELVAAALDQAAPGRVVLGPDFGGGFYLIALAEPCPELFTGLEEGAATVSTAIRQRVADLGLELRLLPERGDVDTFADLVAMWERRLGGEGDPGQ